VVALLGGGIELLFLCLLQSQARDDMWADFAGSSCSSFYHFGELEATEECAQHLHPETGVICG